jgi:starch synthase
MLDAVKRAKGDYDNKEKWKSLVIRAMCCDFSWEASAETYEKMFEELLEA